MDKLTDFNTHNENSKTTLKSTANLTNYAKAWSFAINKAEKYNNGAVCHSRAYKNKKTGEMSISIFYSHYFIDNYKVEYHNLEILKNKGLHTAKRLFLKNTSIKIKGKKKSITTLRLLYRCGYIGYPIMGDYKASNQSKLRYLCKK